MRWDSALYNNNHDFVANYGKALLDYLPRERVNTILDLGCGTGVLTKELAEKCTEVIAVDSSDEMIKQCKQAYPDLHFQVMDACQLIWNEYFDIVFSNAVLHWVQDQNLLLSNIHKVLKPHGTFICEFGGFGNIAKIQNAFSSVIRQYTIEYINPFYFPTTNEYEQKLISHGFSVKEIFDFDRPTPLEDGAQGLYNWVKQFFAREFSPFTPLQQERIIKEMEELLSQDLWDGNKWNADYRRIRVIACKESVV